ncbi:3-deoxy-8-phosphooctulonate synthase [Hirschia baltica]|uniref:2-dehydro-3-deoxyphosphooctonate aldolase n=1 Tax=Hirschia baltica (strain ATCC 49814 / DSM 5838 / IFAM 1418) TaxID=582402 RepID=C6XJF6_HIRBI|nr:3-deoxy-8-phosphooctulonate synthase [Hirschia baltica]ACT59251.1 2-dehydro-3-deoxyphosphooctonate aldolase [Hirschia baltica ATCC 49814]
MSDTSSVKALNSTVEIACPRGNIKIGPDAPLTFFLGPCALESREHALFMSNAILEIADKLGAQVVYKTSFDKANRTSMSGYRGLELDEALDIFAEVKDKTGLPMLTDVHLPDQCEKVAKVVDVLQIPAFLCRQTDMLQAAAETGAVVKVKKGQFLAPWDMKNVVNKLISMGAKDVLLTERGSSFGYNALVTDMRGLPEMAAMAPVVIDATHSVQQPGGKGGSTGGQREYVPVIAKAAVAVGVSGVFLETHQDPDNAPSDGPNMVILSELEKLMSELIQINALVKSF